MTLFRGNPNYVMTSVHKEKVFEFSRIHSQTEVHGPLSNPSQVLPGFLRFHHACPLLRRWAWFTLFTTVYVTHFSLETVLQFGFLPMDSIRRLIDLLCEFIPNLLQSWYRFSIIAKLSVRNIFGRYQVHIERCWKVCFFI